METAGYLCQFCYQFISKEAAVMTCPNCNEYKGLTPVIDVGEEYQQVTE